MGPNDRTIPGSATRPHEGPSGGAWAPRHEGKWGSRWAEESGKKKGPGARGPRVWDVSQDQLTTRVVMIEFALLSSTRNVLPDIEAPSSET